MTAQLLPVSPRLRSPISPWLSNRTSKQLSDRPFKQLVSPASATGEPASLGKSGSPDPDKTMDKFNLDSFWKTIAESLQQGVLIVADDLSIVYANLKGKDLSRQMSNVEEGSSVLPSAIADVCHQLLREDTLTNKPLVIEVQGKEGELVRLRIGKFHFDLNNQSYILVELEDCYERLQEELRIERKKYDLTQREAEIWLLLRQEYTYQEISEILQISQNTVKTHVKNVYAKRRSQLD